MALPNGFAMYSESGQDQFEDLVQEYATLVKRIAHHLLARLPDTVQADDLVQSGMIGLIEAAKKYDGTKGASFETYAGIRIRGAMLDEIRKGDWAPRSVHRKSREIAAAIKSVEAKLGRDAQDNEVAKELGLSVEEYHQHLQDSVGSRLFSFDDLISTQGDEGDRAIGVEPSPFEDIQSLDFQNQLADAIKTLPEREQLILALYYDEELNLKEIGKILGVSESRVSQIHSQAAHRLKSRLIDWDDRSE